MIESIDSLKKISISTKKSLEQLYTQNLEWSGGYVSRSGGTTSKPSYSVFSGDDWQALIQRSVDVFRSVGMKQGDRVANCLSSGNLYGGFISFAHINSAMGAISFGFSTNAEPEVFVETDQKFDILVQPFEEHPFL